MLVLSRKRDESVEIGEGENTVTVTIVDIRGDKIRLGFSGPKHISIHRQEVADAIRREKRPIEPGGKIARQFNAKPNELPAGENGAVV